MLLLLLVCVFFFYRRHTTRKRGFFQPSEPKPRSMLLAGEDMDDDHGYRSSSGTPAPPMMRYTDHPASHDRSPSSDSGPRLMRPRASESGSIFHEGGVWPPPSERSKLVDPMRAGSEIDLNTIVDDVMGNSHHVGPGPSRLRGGTRESSTSIASLYSRASWAGGPLAGGNGKHTRDVSGSSETGLLAIPPLSHPEASVPAAPSMLPSRIHTHTGPSQSTISVQSTLGGTSNWLDRSPRRLANESVTSLPTSRLPRGTPPVTPNTAKSRLP